MKFMITTDYVLLTIIIIIIIIIIITYLLRKQFLKHSVLTLGNIKSCLHSRSTHLLLGGSKS